MLRHRVAHAVASSLATLAATVYLYVTVPKGFFPQQDTGLIIGVDRRPRQDISFAAWSTLQRARPTSSWRTRTSTTCDYWSAQAGRQPGPYDDHLKPLRPSAGDRRPDHRAAAADAGQVPGIALFMQAAPGHQVGGRLSATSTSTHCRTPTSRS